MKKRSSSCPINLSDLQVCQRTLPDYHSNIFLIYNLHLQSRSLHYDYQMLAYLFQKALNSVFWSNLVWFCTLSSVLYPFFVLYSNVWWWNMLNQFESGLSKFDSAQISLTFSRTSLEVSLSTDVTPSILKQSLWLYCSFSSQEAAMALFCFFNSLICFWRKFLFWQSWWGDLVCH